MALLNVYRGRQFTGMLYNRLGFHLVLLGFTILSDLAHGQAFTPRLARVAECRLIALHTLCSAPRCFND